MVLSFVSVTLATENGTCLETLEDTFDESLMFSKNYSRYDNTHVQPMGAAEGYLDCYLHCPDHHLLYLGHTNGLHHERGIRYVLRNPLEAVQGTLAQFRRTRIRG